MFIFGAQASVAAGTASGMVAGLMTKSALKGVATSTVVGGTGGAITGYLTPKAGNFIGGLETDIGGFIMSLLSNSLRLQNKITKFYNNATNGVAEAMTDHINVGYGVVRRAVNTF